MESQIYEMIYCDNCGREWEACNFPVICHNCGSDEVYELDTGHPVNWEYGEKEGED